MKKMIKSVDDYKDIKLAIFESIVEIKEENDFEGQTRGISNSTYTNLTEQNTSSNERAIKTMSDYTKNNRR